MTRGIIISAELSHFIKENSDDYYTLQLMLFFADHPYTRFNELAIIHALNPECGRRGIQKALRELVAKGIIKTCVDSNMHLYSLLENARSLILELAGLDLGQRQPLLRQTIPSSIRGNGDTSEPPAPKVTRKMPNVTTTSPTPVNFNQVAQKSFSNAASPI